MLHAHLVHSDKPFIGSAAGAEGAGETLEMARIAFGEELGDRPVCISLINSLSPLGYATDMLDALLAYAGARQPVVVAALAMGGATAPITLAGLLSMQTAELLAGVELRDVARPHMERLAQETGVAISLGRRDRFSMVYVEHANAGKGVLTLGLSVGDRVPLMKSAMGRAYLAGLPEPSRQALLDSLRQAFPEQWPVFEAQMQTALEDVARHGCCFSFGDWHKDIHAVGVAMQYGTDRHLYAFNCGGPAARLERRYLIDKVAPRMRDMVAAITETHVTGVSPVTSNPRKSGDNS